MIRQVNATTGKRLAEAISEAQAQQIAGVIGEGLGEGEGVISIAKRVEEVFSVRRKEAKTIARTEVLKATQTAQLEAFDHVGVERKQWNTALDADVRDAHAIAEGQVRELDEPFDLGTELADAPGIGAGGGLLSAANSINCRCFLTPVVVD